MTNPQDVATHKKNEIKGRVEPYIDKDGTLVAWRPDPSLDWSRLTEMPEEEALKEIFAVQTSNGYDWLLPADFGGYLFTPILGWNVQRDEKGKFISAENIYRFCGYRVIDALSKLQPGRGVVFYKTK